MAFPLRSEKLLAANPSWPLYRRIAEVLRSEIVAGTFQDGARLPSEAELAAEWGVNHQTLRKSLRILAEQRLITQCQGRGTFVSYRREPGLKVGLVCHRQPHYQSDMYLLRVIVSLNQVLSRDFHASLVIIESTPDVSEMLNAVNRAECDAIISISPFAEDNRRLCAPAFDHLPTVFINPCIQDLPAQARYQVSTAPGLIELGVRKLFEYGCRKIAFISTEGDQASPTFRRNEEFQKTIRELQLSNAWCRIEPPGDWFQMARQAARELWSCPANERPDALLCAGYIFSCGAWQGLMDMNIKVPQDIIFIGFDMDQSVNPDVVTLAQPLEALCRQAAELIFDLRNKGKHLERKLYHIPGILSVPPGMLRC